MITEGQLPRLSGQGKARPNQIRNYEGKSISEEDLRQVQDHSPQRCGPGDLHQPQAQAASGLGLGLVCIGE